MKTTLINPDDLRPFSAIKTFPRWDRESPEWLGFVEDIKEFGVRQPLQVTEDHRVIDGETRRQAAIAAGVKEVPCVIVPEEEANLVVLRELARRRNLSKGQIAYLAYPFLEHALGEAKQRRLKNLRNSPNFVEANSVGFGKTREEAAKLLGISDELYDQAGRLHKLFAKDPDLKAEWEPKILSLDKPVGIGAALAGIGGAGADQSKRDEGVLKGQLELFGNSFDDLKKAGRGWQRFESDQRKMVLQYWRKTIAALPQDLREALIHELEVTA